MAEDLEDLPTVGLKDQRRRWDSFDLWYYFLIERVEIRRRDYQGLGWVMRDLHELQDLRDHQE